MAQITPDMAWDMKTMYEAGYGLNDIAPRYGMTEGGIRYHLIKLDTVMRPQGVRAPARATRMKLVLNERRAVMNADKEARQHQICDFCGSEYARDRWTILCGEKRCRQQRDYLSRRNDPVKYALIRLAQKNYYKRKKESNGRHTR